MAAELRASAVLGVRWHSLRILHAQSVVWHPLANE